MRQGGPSFLTGSVFALGMGALTLPGGTLAAQEADFLFQRPRATLGVFGGWASASADSDIFDMTSDLLTVDRGDFASGYVGVQLGVRATERFDLSLRAGIARSEVASEYRDWVDLDDFPIEQSSALRRVPLTASLRYYARERGRSVGQFAWIPSDWSPYVGAGGGLMVYHFEQAGDWIDFDDPDLPIRSDRFVSEGVAPTAHVMAGVDVSLTPRLFLSAEGQYAWASAEMDRPDFGGFDDIDLSGFQLTVGLSARF